MKPLKRKVTFSMFLVLVVLGTILCFTEEGGVGLIILFFSVTLFSASKYPYTLALSIPGLVIGIMKSSGHDEVSPLGISLIMASVFLPDMVRNYFPPKKKKSNKEIERKYLAGPDFVLLAPGTSAEFCHVIKQGYIYSSKEITVRVRAFGDKALITIKGATEGISRDEFEYPIPVDDARYMLDNMCRDVIEKVRVGLNYKGYLWEIDAFKGRHEGLVLGEVELEDESEKPEVYPGLTEDVSEDRRYFNSVLAKEGLPQIGETNG